MLINQTWAFNTLGTGIGIPGLHSLDLNNDGNLEIIAGSSQTNTRDSWNILSYIEESETYEIIWRSPNYASSITNITPFRNQTDDSFDILVGFSNGEVLIYDGATLTETGAIQTSGSVSEILKADIDNDSIEDLVIGHHNKILVYDTETYELKHEINEEARDFKISNVDQDSNIEIVLANGKVLEFDGNDTVLEWEHYEAFGNSIELSDIDQDGQQEIIGAESWNYITAFDADIQSPKWQLTTDQDIAALYLKDINQDGIDDIIYGDGQWGSIHAYDPTTLTKVWEIENPEHGVTNITINDTDGDGEQEVLWGAGATSSGADFLYVYDMETQTQEWQNQHIDGPYSAVEIHDVDQDGQQEILFTSASSNSGYDDGYVFSYDGTTHDLEWQSSFNAFGSTAWTNLHDLGIGDVDNDGVQDIVVSTDRLYDGAIYIFDGETQAQKQYNFYDNGSPIHALAIGDVDNDGETEIIAGGSRRHSGSPGVYTYIIDGATGTVEWNSINLGGNHVQDIAVANLDEDDELEILAVNDRLFRFDPTNFQQRQSAITDVTDIDVFDLDKDGTEEILVSHLKSHVSVLNPENLEVDETYDIGVNSIRMAKAYDFDQDGTAEIVFGTFDTLGIYSIEHSRVLWQSEALGRLAGSRSLDIGDINGNGLAEIVVGTQSQVLEFEVPDFIALSPPELIQPIDDIVTSNHHSFSLSFEDYFQHPDQEQSLIYSAEGLPNGLSLDQDSGLLSGQSQDVGMYDITVTATSASGLSISESFELKVFNLIHLTPQDDQELGTEDSDWIRGRGGNDHLSGYRGDDLIFGGLGDDRLIGGSGHDTLKGDSGRDLLIGNGGHDYLVGGAENDRLIGGQGLDTLKGGAGQDKFIFKHYLHKADRILDFERDQDTLLIYQSGFNLDLPKGRLARSKFTVGSAAQNRNHRFIYNHSNGVLLFDTDGSGSQSAQTLAILNPGTELSASYLRII